MEYEWDTYEDEDFSDYDAEVMEQMAEDFLWETDGIGYRADDDGYDYDNYGYAD